MAGPVAASASTTMIIERDFAIPMDDGIALRADIFRPDTGSASPVIMSLGPYGKGVRYQDGYAAQWQWLFGAHPEILDGSTGSYLTWETVDPDRWVPEGYAVVRVDSRGNGRSPGTLDCFSPREVRDYFLAIEWAATQPWCTGKVGLCGISYYAINQWSVASLQPPHLAAMIPWEGAADFYRDVTRHGGILSNNFLQAWYPRQVLSVQHGRGTRGPMDPWLGEPAAGPETLSEDELVANRSDFVGSIVAHPLDDDFHRQRSADLSKITVPFLSAANWAGFGLHERGNFEAFVGAASDQKWLEVHRGHHEEKFYLAEGRELQRRFFDYFLKGDENGWNRAPRVLLSVHSWDGRVEQRGEEHWPLARTQWTRLYLDPANLALAWEQEGFTGQSSFEAIGEPITLMAPPLERETELTGPVAATLWLSSSTTDADVFVTLRAFLADNTEVVFQGANEPAAPLAQGWLRASHRKLDIDRSLPFRPFHAHDGLLPLVPRQMYELDIEIWPTCVVLPVGCRLALTIGGHDFERPMAAPATGFLPRGSGPFLHTHPEDRPPAVYAGITTIHSSPGRESFLLLPVIPA